MGAAESTLSADNIDSDDMKADIGIIDIDDRMSTDPEDENHVNLKSTGSIDNSGCETTASGFPNEAASKSTASDDSLNQSSVPCSTQLLVVQYTKHLILQCIGTPAVHSKSPTGRPTQNSHTVPTEHATRILVAQYTTNLLLECIEEDESKSVPKKQNYLSSISKASADSNQAVAQKSTASTGSVHSDSKGSTNSSDTNIGEDVIIIDHSGGYISAGFATPHEIPRASSVFPCVIGRLMTWKMRATGMQSNTEEWFVGEAALRPYCGACYPMLKQFSVNWDHMERIWYHTFCNELRIDPFHQTLLMTESPFTPKAHRERIVQIMFETFGVRALCLTVSAVMAVYKSGGSGAAIEIGEDVSYAVPVYLGRYPLYHAAVECDVGMADVVEQMELFVTLGGYRVTTSGDRRKIRELTTELGFCAFDFEEECVFAESVGPGFGAHAASFEMPDGTFVYVCAERFQALEVLFQPSRVGKHGKPGLSQAILQSIMKCEADIRGDLFANIVVTGGSVAELPGIVARLTKDLYKLREGTSLTKDSLKEFRSKKELPSPKWISDVVCVRADKGAPFTGSVKFVRDAGTRFSEFCVLRSEFDDRGPQLANIKCA